MFIQSFDSTEQSIACCYTIQSRDLNQSSRLNLGRFFLLIIACYIIKNKNKQ